MDVYPHFYDHEVVRQSPDDYVELSVSPEAILSAWSLSLFAHEILDKNGSVKPLESLKDATLEKFIEADEAFKHNRPVAKPVIGVGIMDGVEIGIGREVIAAAATNKIGTVSVHVRHAQAKDIKGLLDI